MRRFKLLSILHYIWGGYCIFTMFFYLTVFVYLDYSDYRAQMSTTICVNEPFIGDACETWTIVLMILTSLSFLGIAIVNLFAALSYKRAKITTANWIAACLNLILGFPIGTVLGVYSLRKLNTYLKELQDSHND